MSGVQRLESNFRHESLWQEGFHQWLLGNSSPIPYALASSAVFELVLLQTCGMYDFRISQALFYGELFIHVQKVIASFLGPFTT